MFSYGVLLHDVFLTFLLQNLSDDSVLNSAPHLMLFCMDAVRKLCSGKCHSMWKNVKWCISEKEINYTNII